MLFGIEIEYLGMGSETSTIRRRLRNQGVDMMEWDLHYDSSIEGDTVEPDCDCQMECDEDHSCNCSGDTECDCDTSCYCELGCCCEEQYESGIELVSPPLDFNEGNLKQVSQVLKALGSEGAWTNNSCGLHVHIDASFVRNYSPEKQDYFFMHILQKYAEMEDELDESMDSSRRGNRNQYCGSVKNLSVARAKGDRYFKLNISAFMRHGTIEFRHFHGTLDEDEVLPWIEFCHNFMVQAKTEVDRIMNDQAVIFSNSLYGFGGL